VHLNKSTNTSGTESTEAGTEQFGAHSQLCKRRDAVFCRMTRQNRHLRRTAAINVFLHSFIKDDT